MKTTMMWKTSIVPIILLLLAAVTNAAAAKAWKHKYIVKPKPMDANDVKHSQFDKYITAKKKYEEKLIEVEKCDKIHEKAGEKLKATEKIIADGKAATNDAIAAQKQAVTQATTAHDEAKQAHADEKEVEWKEETCAKEDWPTHHKEAVEAKKKIEDETKENLTAAEKELTKLEADQKACTANWDEKKADYKNKDAKDSDLCKWAQDAHKDWMAVEKAAAALKKAGQDGQYYEKKKKDDDPEVPEKPEAGGRDYWKGKMKEAKRVAEQDGSVELAQLKLDAGGDEVIRVEGFMGDFHGTEVLIASDLELDDVKKLFEYVVDAKPGYNDGKPETKVFAEVRQAKKDDVPSVTLDSYLRLNSGVERENQKNHGGMIRNLVVYVETFQSKRDKYETKDGGEPVKIPVTGGNKQEDVLRKYLNLQLLDAMIYTNSHDQDNSEKPYNKRFEELKLVRESNDYDILGNIADLSKAIVPDPVTGSTPSDATTKKEGTNAWMIIGIICLVVIFLGGAVIAYRAYTASGSLQNTDI